MYTLSIAPMLDITDRHCRVFFRLFSPHIRLYSEMIHCGAILFGDRERFLGFNECEHPVAIQLGGSDPVQLAQAAKIAEDYGYDEVNLNVGCPSDRVQAGRFGACLMAEPPLVAECVSAMIEAVAIPVTVKNRIGIDDQDARSSLQAFVSCVAQAGCREFIVHARKAWLKGLSPKDNRSIPPLDYELVYALAARHPDLDICINGGINTLDEAQAHLQHVKGVMMGRAPIDNPWLLSKVHRLYGENSAPFQSRSEIVLAYCDYIEQQLREGVWLKHMVAPLMGLYKGQPNAKFWRRSLAERCRAPDAGIELITGVLAEMPD
ncbi:MAG: tRNA dihydrouridine(20/20a) synthase DusA [Proteobacteria bacterium]|nr:tRNA dihydrouridine(20/20a) synthase DusA [Pseudomonadota bacterium]